jgi:hypothetical protein
MCSSPYAVIKSQYACPYSLKGERGDPPEGLSIPRSLDLVLIMIHLPHKLCGQGRATPQKTCIHHHTHALRSQTKFACRS